MHLIGSHLDQYPLLISRLKQLLECKNILRPDFSWDHETSDKDWNYNVEIIGAFGMEDMLEKTCPLSFHKNGKFLCIFCWIFTF